VRPQLARPLIVGGLSAFAVLATGMYSEALASGNQPIVNTACASPPKSTQLLAVIVPAAGSVSHVPSTRRQSARAGSSASPTPSESSSGQPTTSTSPSPTSPSPSKSATGSPSPSKSPTPKPSSTTKTPSKSPSPTTSPTTSPSPSKSPSPSPSPSKSPKPPRKKTPQLCVVVESFSSASQVKPGADANFAVWVWSARATSYAVSVSAQVAQAEYVGIPHFSICPVVRKRVCEIGNLPTGQADELEVSIKVGRKAALGEQVQLTAKASARGSKSFSGSATDVVVALPASHPSTTPIITLPPASLPAIAGTGVVPSNPSGLFPTVAPAPSASPSTSLGLPHVRPVPHHALRVTDASATVPLDSRLIGGQLAGLAVLAGAVALAIARLSLRAPKPPADKQ
jgi:hypothetical protein